ncbi:MAG TPA: carboxypeptidase regulatory-like domain-containing protein [Candidatus Eisenbacteria bacterium]|nr:carboxypeptidase regulatory-like domain-containing protein [Candidatus Eisenbacteria bacterium]
MQGGLFAGAVALVVGVASPGALVAGSVSGQVVFDGPLPAAFPVKVSKDQDYCGETLVNDAYVIEPGGGLKNVVVFVETAPVGEPNPQRENVLDNTGCRYVPRVLALRRGETLKVRNNDPKLHIPHAYLGERTIFTLSLPFKGTTIDASSRIRQAGIVKVVCDTHAWMLAYIHVFDHPYFAVTDEQGRFTITGLAPGVYTLRAWHEAAGVRSRTIWVAPDGAARADFVFGRELEPSNPD